MCSCPRTLTGFNASNGDSTRPNANDSGARTRMADQTSIQERWRSLDGIRGLAIILVVISHAFPGTYAMGGPAGVSLFFVLSGFLITSLLLSENESNGRIDLKKFFGRRALRLGPALIVYLSFMVILQGWSATLPTLFYLGNYAQIAGGYVGANAHTWSLAVEEHFYLVWPLLFVFLSASKPKRRLVWVASATVLLLGWRFAVPDGLWAYVGTDTNAYALALGCLVGSCQRSMDTISSFGQAQLGGDCGARVLPGRIARVRSRLGVGLLQ